MWSVLRELVIRLGGLLGRHRRRDEADFDDEMRLHLDMLTAAHLSRGHSPENARRLARLEFGNPAVVRELQRERTTLVSIESVLADARYAWRACLKSPAFTAIAVLTLAIGIGVNATFFTALDAAAFRPLPVRDAESLIRLERWFASGARGNGQYFFSIPEYRYLRDRDDFGTDLVSVSWMVSADADGGGGQPPRGQFVSANYFTMLGVAPQHGRTLRADEGVVPGRDPVVVLSHAFWQRQFTADPQAVGRILRLNNVTFTIVGVMPATFIGTANPPEVADFWAPQSMQAELLRGRAGADSTDLPVQILGRLAADVTLQMLDARGTAVAADLARTFPGADRTTALTVERATVFGLTNDPRFHTFIAILMATVALVLLVACANLANMLLARGSGRQKEIGLRLALGASRGRVVRQLLTESLVLASLGGFAGLLVSMWASRVLWIAMLETIQLFVGGAGFVVPMSPDLRVVIYTVAISAIAAMLFGLSPAWRASNVDLNSSLKTDAGILGVPLRRSRLRGLLVGAQVAISMALLIGAGLLIRGMWRSRIVDPGFDASRLFIVSFTRPAEAGAADFQSRVLSAIKASPGIGGATPVDRFPLAGTWTPPATPLSDQTTTDRPVFRTLANRVGGEYFETVGIPIVRGRGFARDETESTTSIVIVSESAARLFWPNRDPLGKHLVLDLKFRGRLKEFEVVGVAADVRSANLSRVDPAYVYLPIDRTGHEGVLLRVTGNPGHALSDIRAAVSALDAGVAARMTMTSLADGPMRLQRILPETLATFAGALAIVALLLAAAGIYGVLTYLANQRVYEIGVRLALGATRADVLRLVLTEGLRPVIVGAICGLAGALLVSALLRSLLSFPGTPDPLFGLSGFDPLTLAALVSGVAAIAVFASAGPAWRAMRVDPVRVLRRD